MEDFTINEMQDMQRKLQDKYKEKWESIGPETGKNKLLWMNGIRADTQKVQWGFREIA